MRLKYKIFSTINNSISHQLWGYHNYPLDEWCYELLILSDGTMQYMFTDDGHFEKELEPFVEGTEEELFQYDLVNWCILSSKQLYTMQCTMNNLLKNNIRSDTYHEVDI